MTDEKDWMRLNSQLSGPLLTDPRRVAKIKARPADEPPMPAWWDDDDEEASSTSINAARQLGLA